MTLNGVAQIAQTIIKEQELVVGPVAMELAQSVAGLHVTNMDNISIEGDSAQVLSKLVEAYSKLFGEVSVGLCRSAVQRLHLSLPENSLPDVLK